MFSGGIDSLATLRANHLRFSPGHPVYICDGIVVSWLQCCYEGDEQLEARSLDLSQQVVLA